MSYRVRNRGRKLDEKLQQQSEEQSQILEAKLKAQGVEQIQQLDEKLREQSTQQSEQLQQLAATLDLKMQQKGRRAGPEAGSHAAGTGKQD